MSTENDDFFFFFFFSPLYIVIYNRYLPRHWSFAVFALNVRSIVGMYCAYDMTRAVKRVGVTCQIYPFVISLAADIFRLVKIILIREVSRNDRAIRGEKRVGMG